MKKTANLIFVASLLSAGMQTVSGLNPSDSMLLDAASSNNLDLAISALSAGATNYSVSYICTRVHKSSQVGRLIYWFISTKKPQGFIDTLSIKEILELAESTRYFEDLSWTTFCNELLYYTVEMDRKDLAAIGMMNADASIAYLCWEEAKNRELTEVADLIFIKQAERVLTERKKLCSYSDPSSLHFHFKFPF